MRIARALALAGIDSRRKCEAFIENGEVTVNGKPVVDLSTQVEPSVDHICLRGHLLLYEKPVYYILNKPDGYTTTAEDAHAKRIVYELLPRTLCKKSARPRAGKTRVFPVGRLDRDSTGLLLFTNDGELANQLMHPSFGVDKWYQVRLNRAWQPEDRDRLMRGVRLREGMARVERMHCVSRRVLRVQLREGKKREVRRIFYQLGYRVQALCRIAFGPLKLDALLPGQGRFLNKKEVQALHDAVAQKH